MLESVELLLKKTSKFHNFLLSLNTGTSVSFFSFPESMIDEEALGLLDEESIKEMIQ
jgi:hypothetical protein